MALRVPRLNRRIQIQRLAEGTPNGQGGRDRQWQDHGVPIYAQRADVKDAERNAYARVLPKLISRFTIRDGAFARSILRRDRLICDGVAFEIDGIKEVPPGRAFLEITAFTEDQL